MPKPIHTPIPSGEARELSWLDWLQATCNPAFIAAWLDAHPAARRQADAAHQCHVDHIAHQTHPFTDFADTEPQRP